MEEKNMPRRGENIYKRKDGRWEARYIYAFKEDGSPRYRSIYAADYLTVKKKQNDAKRKMDPRLFQSVRMKKNISFYGLLWLKRLKPSSKESTYVRYHYLFSHYISPMIGDRLTPTAEFGIGLQSAFIVTNLFKCRTYTRSNEKYEITFSTVKSNFYEGYINVQPLEKEEAFGTCFEVFVPISKKLRHQLYPSAWDGKDYFDEDYEVLRPVRHAAELLAQMALYLDRQIGEQLFPVHLKVKKVKCVDIPLNISEKNQLKRLQYDAQESLNDQNQVILKEMKESGVLGEGLEGVEFLAQRQWEKDGTSWIYYNGNQDNDILDIQTGRAIALIDCKNGYFYFWDNQLCTFCTINMEKFLYLEKNELENADKECMNVHRNISIYYKGIILEEIEVSDLGNELIQSIDIKGKLAREYINLNRKGLTEMGRLYFKDEIYKKLLESIHDTLKKINRKHKEMVVAII